MLAADGTDVRTGAEPATKRFCDSSVAVAVVGEGEGEGEGSRAEVSQVVNNHRRLPSKVPWALPLQGP